MRMLLVFILFLAAAFLITKLVNAHEVAEKKKREYRDECARRELIEREERDINLDGEND